MIHSFRGRMPRIRRAHDARRRALPAAIWLSVDPDADVRPLADLEASLMPAAVPTAVRTALARLGGHERLRDADVSLEACAYDPERGDLWLALDSGRPRVPVARGDVFASGIALTWQAAAGLLQVAPRLLRVVCTNGQLLPANRDLGSHVYAWSPQDGACGDLEDALASGFSRRVLERTATVLGAARRMLLADPVGTLEDAALALAHALRPHVLRVFARRGDRSGYGLLNAITQAARDAASVGEQIALEQAAGRLIAYFGRPRSARVPAAAGRE